MKKTKIGLNEEFPYCIEDGNVYCETLCKYGVWERSPLDEDVKAFKSYEYAELFCKQKNIISHNIVIPYKEWEEKE